MRPRKKDRHLPRCVYHHHGAYWLVKKGKWTNLGKTLPTDFAERLTRQTAMTTLIDAALATIKPTVSKSTWRNYQTAAEKLKYAFREFAPQQVSSADVWEFRDKCADIPGMTNRCLSLLKQVFNYAVRRRIVEVNPVIGVERHSEPGRERLISEAEFIAIYDKAKPRLQVIMDLLYLTGQRVNDVLRLRRDAITDEGIYFRQQKTGKKLVVQWTPELKEAVERAKALKDVPALTLLQGRYRGPPDYRSVQRQWKDACRDAGVPDSQLRDLRAMSLTDAEDEGKNPTALAGHSSPAMTARYLRRKRIAKVEGPAKTWQKRG